MILTFLADGEVSHDTLLASMIALFGISITSPIAVLLIQSRNRRHLDDIRLIVNELAAKWAKDEDDPE